MATLQDWKSFRDSLEDADNWNIFFDQDGITMICELAEDDTIMLNWKVKHLDSTLNQTGVEYFMIGRIIVEFKPKDSE